MTSAERASHSVSAAASGSAPAYPAADDRCPCLSGETYAGCCGKYHSGAQDAPTAEALMRSRYSAFAVGDQPYLLKTWHPSTRPAVLELDRGLQWRRLDIVETSAGGPLDDHGVVRFRAHYRDGAARGIQEETSRFVRANGVWLYVDGE
ncbi:YchJ family protein [Arthrobacter sp. 08Y14]|uniref:YchJ family protein n=1 Tax=Arthrobacter sp. 08Y14 TaxID=2058885 RepID=UPI0015E46A32|nr:YchJ family protein [Arthrobacter sp. 08Y14]